MAGALALGACRRDGRQTTAQPQYTEPAPQAPDTAAPDTAMQTPDTTGAQAPGQDTTGQTVPGQQPTPDTMAQQPVAAGPCPIDVQGTVARVEETPEGIAIAFTTSGDVAGLRLRVQRLADLHNQRHAERMQAMMQEQAAAQEQQGARAGTKKGKAGKKSAKARAAAKEKAGTEDQTAQADQSGAAGTPDVIGMTQARVEELPDGARLVYTLHDPATIETMRETMREPLRAHAQIVAGPQCDPLSETGQGLTPGATSQR